MTELALTPLVLCHVAISLIAIALGLSVLLALLKGSLPAQSNQLFLLFTFLTNATGLMIAPPGPPPSPAQITAIVALIALAVGLYAFYVRHMAGRWRAIMSSPPSSGFISMSSSWWCSSSPRSTPWPRSRAFRPPGPCSAASSFWS